MTMSETMIAALEARGLDAELADRLGFSTVLRAGIEWLEIPCFKDGRVWRRKYRTLTGKKQFSQEGDGPIPWNVDVLLDSSLKGMPLIITEGELDAMAAIQCGFPRTISVPDGAPQEASAEPYAEKRYAWVENLRVHLGRHEISEIILATDGDGPGRALMQDLSAMLGRFRCKFLTYPMALDSEKRGRDRLKDLNEVLQDYGQQAVAETINRATFIQSEGVYRMEELPELPPSVAYGAGFSLFDENYRVRMGDFCVITGIPSHGKSAFANDFFCRIAMTHGLRIAWASFENHPIRDHRRILRTWYAEMPEREMSLDDTVLADAWIDRQHRLIIPPEDSDVSLEWMIETMEQAVVQHDCQIIVIDPWNEMDHMREKNETETEYVGRAIKAFKRFARAFQIHLVIIAHPTKVRRDEHGRTPMPNLYDIAGSAHWNNKADIGIIVHRETEDETIIKVAKSRYHREIGRPGSVSMHFGTSDFHYRETERIA
jgi:twinkle protein